MMRLMVFSLVCSGLFTEVLFAQNNHPTDSTRQLLLEAAREIIKSAGNVALITQDENGIPQVRTMEPFPPERNFTIWLATQPNTRKVKQIKQPRRDTVLC